MPAPRQQDDDMFGLVSLTPAVLTQITSAAVGRAVRPASTRVTPIPYDWGSPATAGLWRVDVSGQPFPAPGHDARAAGPVSYTYFVKLLRHPRRWPGLAHLPDQASRDEFVGFFPWRFELDMVECGIGDVLPAGMRTPWLHHVTRADGDHLGLWWEFVTERPAPWDLADYRRAAFLLGRLAARRQDGADVNRLLPPVCRQAHPSGSSLRFFTERRVLRGVLPVLRAGKIWDHPLASVALRQSGDMSLPADMLALAGRLPGVLDMLDRLPQTYAHGDASPQNLLLPDNQPGTIAVIDWGFGSLLPIGFDLGQLLVGLAHAGRSDPAALPDIDAAIFPAYLDGLAAEDYRAAPAQVRAGYLGALAARSALSALPLELLSRPLAKDAEAEFLHRLRLTRALIGLTAGITSAEPEFAGGREGPTKPLALHDRPEEPAGPAGVVAQGSGNAGGTPDSQDGDHQVAQGGHDARAAGGADLRAVFIESRGHGPSAGGLRSPSGRG
jgi:Phosphotransferase enzyme family